MTLPVLRDLSPNDLAPTPLMGWSSRQKLGSRTDDATIRQAVEGLVESGLNLLGYVYVEIGDGWQGARDAQGVLHPNERFPDMKALGDFIHAQGLKFGLTASAAYKSCNGMEGSYGHEEEDARTFAEWGVDYVVHEWCGAETLHPTEPEMRAVFQKMGEALRASGRDIVYGISQKGQFNVGQWAPRTGANLWRTGNELEENWASVATAGFGQNGKEFAAGPGAWNDPGLLQIGNTGMSADASRMQMNLWTVLSAPLMLGNDVRIMTRETVALLSNREVIAVNQDKLGRQGKRIVQPGDTQVWAKPLADGSVAVAFFNTGTRTTAVAVNWDQLGSSGPQLARDLWWRENSRHRQQQLQGRAHRRHVDAAEVLEARRRARSDAIASSGDAEALVQDAREQRGRRIAIGRKAARFLEFADGRTRAAAENAVRAAGVVAERGQSFLQRDALADAQHLFAARPASSDAGLTFQPVGQHAHRQRIRRGEIVFEDRVEILVHEERGPRAPAGRKIAADSRAFAQAARR